MEIVTGKLGASGYKKVSYPIRYGRYSQIDIPGYRLQFDLNGEIKYIQGKGDAWHPSEWLKRTIGNDWIYYSSGDYEGVFDLLGEHYIPCLDYPSNSIFGERPFRKKEVRQAVESWHRKLVETFDIERASLTDEERVFIRKVIANGDEQLDERARQLAASVGCPIKVVPPDSRHVDYDVMPVIVADGCSYNCSFCRVKTGSGFRIRQRARLSP